MILTEDLAMRQMEQLIRLKSHGVRFDGYLMDAFWYDPAGAYREWRMSTWPNGPDAWFEACAENNLLPGLWFTANTLFHMDLPLKWRDSIDAKNWGLCLFQGGFLADLMDVFDYWYGRGVRIFKLDFAEFGAVPAGLEGSIEPADARFRNILAYREALSSFKKSHPGAMFLGYNGFEDRECMDRSDHAAGSYIDPKWLEVLDSVYCGDPRPSDLPGPFWRSVDFYSDCMVRLFESSGIPLERIDNCGFMAGPTGTCYWRGKAGWKEMLLLSLARGGKVHVSYGDLSLITDEDAEWWAAVQKLLLPFLEQGTTSSFGGWPGGGEAFGWLSVKGDEAICTVASPGLTVADVDLPASPSGKWRLLGSNDSHVGSGAEGRISLSAASLAVFTCYEDFESLEFDGSGDAAWVEVSSASSASSGLKLDLEEVSGVFRLVVFQKDSSGEAHRTFFKDGEFPISVSVTDEDGRRELPPIFDRPIWSGISWTLNEFEARGLVEVCATGSDEAACLNAKLYVR